MKKNADFYICGAFTQHPAGCTIFMVKDMEVSLKFYVDKLGFTVTREWTPRGKIQGH